jgi:hypothetical protein
MHNFKKYIQTTLGFFGWQPLEYCKQQHKFMNDVAKAAKKNGYKQVIFAENDKQERLIKFIKIKNG